MLFFWGGGCSCILYKTQREIAGICGVGLGNIPQIIEGLMEAGYLVNIKTTNMFGKEKQIDLIRNHHIIPQLNGELEVHEIFWQPENGIAPSVIIYAELLLSGGKRNIETAEIIYNEFIQSIL